MTPNRFAARSLLGEQMDDLNVKGLVVDLTLKELDDINKWLGGNQVTIEGIQTLIGPVVRELQIADLGCGSGTMLKLLANWGRENDVKLKLTGVDANPFIVDFARNNTTSYPEINFQVADIMDKKFSDQKFDIVTSTLFTHHFSDVQLQDLIRIWQNQTRLGIVINDLQRHWLAYYSIKFITELISKSSMVKNDAPISVLRGFSKKDWEALMKNCQITNYSLHRKWAFRWLLTIPTV